MAKSAEFEAYVKSYHDSFKRDLPFSRNNFRSSSKSANPKVLEVYQEILDHEYSDTDHWWLGGNEFIATKLYDLSSFDWLDLKIDISNWSRHQLELFSQILSDEYDAGSVADLIVTERSCLFGYMLTIADHPLLAYRLAINLGFLEEGDPKPKSLLEAILQMFDKWLHMPYIVQKENDEDFYITKEHFNSMKDLVENLKDNHSAI